MWRRSDGLVAGRRWRRRMGVRLDLPFFWWIIGATDRVKCASQGDGNGQFRRLCKITEKWTLGMAG